MLKRIIEAAIFLGLISLAWYGAEMLLYGYSQPSVVKAVVAVLWTMNVVSNNEKERVVYERKQTEKTQNREDCGR